MEPDKIELNVLVFVDEAQDDASANEINVSSEPMASESARSEIARLLARDKDRLVRGRYLVRMRLRDGLKVIGENDGSDAVIAARLALPVTRLFATLMETWAEYLPEPEPLVRQVGSSLARMVAANGFERMLAPESVRIVVGTKAGLSTWQAVANLARLRERHARGRDLEAATRLAQEIASLERTVASLNADEEMDDPMTFFRYVPEDNPFAEWAAEALQSDVDTLLPSIERYAARHLRESLAASSARALEMAAALEQAFPPDP